MSWVQILLGVIEPQGMGWHRRALPPCGHQPASSCLLEDAAYTPARGQTSHHSSAHRWVLAGHSHGLCSCVFLAGSPPFQAAFSH